MSCTTTWNTHFDERSPIYEQIIQLFCRSLVKGELKPSQRIPSIRDLAVDLKVNANTVQRAFQEMERMELIYSKRGTGYFITEGEEMIIKIKTSMVKDAVKHFMEEMYALGFTNSQIIEELNNHIKEVDNGTVESKGVS